MSREDKLKIVLVGPKEVGKTCVANHIAGYKSVIGQEYRPTIGLRICEFERAYNKLKKAAVELWDVSGDTNFENCWGAISQDAQAVIIVFDPEDKNSARDLEFWYNTFVKGNQIDDSCCIVFAHNRRPNSSKGEVRLPKLLSKVACCHTNLDSSAMPDPMWATLDALLERVSDRARDRDESKMMN